MPLDFHKDPPPASHPSDAQPEPSPTTGEVLARRGPDRFVADFVYTTPTIEVARTRLAAALRAAPQHELGPLKEAAFELCVAIDEHEKANLLYHGTWQVAIQRKQREVGTRELSRQHFEQVLREYKFTHELEAHEATAMEHYRKARVYLQRDVFQVRPTISISKTDVEVLINDLANRRINRTTHAFTRELRFNEFDRQLERYVGDIPGHETGKRAELQELYLLRRLIRDANADHLIQVEHGTIPNDLDRGRGSVDFVITIAGHSRNVQAKTLLQKASDTSRAIQYDVMRRAKDKIDTERTLLVEFELDRVTHEYTKAVSEDRMKMSKLGKFEALAPLFDALPEDDCDFLLHALQLTDADLAPERAQIKEKERELETARVVRLRKQAVEAARIAQINAEREAREAAARIAEDERRADIEKRRQEQAERDRLAAIEATARSFAKQAEKLAGLEAQAERRKQHDKAEARVKKAATTRATNAEERAKFWQQGPIMKVALPRHLIRLGFLRSDWATSGGIDVLNRAKQAFADRFAKAKKGKPGSLSDLANDEFIHLFPTEAAFENAQSETLKED